ncbi:hypothetical protein [Demequina sp. NBRC 110057]|uniref:hypothetical protein n=1 Tax=Demequina sp. NBRC 110057 TaxID=1570346 RepID=UPI0009FC0DED|nr:hypothetical protein [Demequina sp. NBRC 110057]
MGGVDHHSLDTVCSGLAGHSRAAKASCPRVAADHSWSREGAAVGVGQSMGCSAQDTIARFPS